MAAPQLNQKDFSFIASYYNAWRVRLMHFGTKNQWIQVIFYV